MNLVFWDLYFGQVEQKFCGINTAQETSEKVSLLITSQQLTAFLLYQSTNRWNLQSSPIARDDEYCFIFLRYSRNGIKFTFIAESCRSKHRMAFSWGPFWPEFQNLLFCALTRRPCRCRYISIVFLVVAVAVSTHLCVVCRDFCCPMSLFQGHVASRNFTARRPFSFLIYLYWKTVNLFVLTTLWIVKYSQNAFLN